MHQHDRLALALVEIGDLDAVVSENLALILDPRRIAENRRPRDHRKLAVYQGASQWRKRIIGERTPTAKMPRHTT